MKVRCICNICDSLTKNKIYDVIKQDYTFYEIINDFGTKQSYLDTLFEVVTNDILDNVEHPSHYCRGGIECIDAIEASLGKDEFTGFLRGNIIKYIWRYKDKNGLEDLKKAQWYLNKLIEVVKNGNN